MTPQEVADLRRWIDQSGGIADGLPFLGDRRTDAFVEVILEMAAQLWVAKRRNATLESLLVEKGLIAPGEIEGHRLPDKRAAALRAERGEFISTLFRSLSELPMEPTTEEPA